MYQSLDLFQLSSQMAAHAGSRQALVARNIANADTPGYRASVLPSFADAYRTDVRTGMTATRPSHLTATSQPGVDAVASGGQPAPNGNDVSLETELLHSIDAGREHRRALAIYKHAMTVVRTALGPAR